MAKDSKNRNKTNTEAKRDRSGEITGMWERTGEGKAARR